MVVKNYCAKLKIERKMFYYCTDLDQRVSSAGLDGGS